MVRFEFPISYDISNESPVDHVLIVSPGDVHRRVSTAVVLVVACWYTQKPKHGFSTHLSNSLLALSLSWSLCITKSTFPLIYVPRERQYLYTGVGYYDHNSWSFGHSLEKHWSLSMWVCIRIERIAKKRTSEIGIRNEHVKAPFALK